MDILGIGECMIEMNAAEGLAHSDTLTRSVGGDVYNTLVAASRLGSKTGFLTKIAPDGFGQVLMDSFAKEGIDTRNVRQALKAVNGLYFVSHQANPDQHQFIYYRQRAAASQISSDFITADLIKPYSIVYATGVTQALSPSARRAVLRAFQLAKQLGKLVCYDPNFRPNLWERSDEALDALIEVLPFVDVIMPSNDDLKSLFNFPDESRTLEYFRLRGINLVALKQGKDGVVLGFKHWQKHMPAESVPSPVDTVGAGDAFNGGFMHGLLRGASLETCAKIGAKVAGESLKGHGPIANLPNGEAIESLLSSEVNATPLVAQMTSGSDAESN